MKISAEFEIVQALTFSELQLRPYHPLWGGWVYFNASFRRGYKDLNSCDINWVFTIRGKSKECPHVESVRVSAKMEGRMVGESVRSFKGHGAMGRVSDYWTFTWLQTVVVSCDKEGFLDLTIIMRLAGQSELVEIPGKAQCAVFRDPQLVDPSLLERLRFRFLRKSRRNYGAHDSIQTRELNQV